MINKFASSPKFTTVLVCMTLAGCAIGPDYARPKLAESSGYAVGSVTAQSESGQSSKTSSITAQKFAIEADIRNDWWTLFQSPKLNTLIEDAFKANPTIEVAQRALNAAQQNVAAQQGFFYPTIGAGYTPSRTKLPGNLSSNAPGIQGDGSVISGYQGTPASEGGTPPYNGATIYNFQTAQLTVGFVPDVFGANRRPQKIMPRRTRNGRFPRTTRLSTHHLRRDGGPPSGRPRVRAPWPERRQTRRAPLQRRRDPRQDQRKRARGGLLRHPVHLHAGQRQPDGASSRARRAAARLREGDQRHHSLLRLCPRRPQGRGARRAFGQAGPETHGPLCEEVLGPFDRDLVNTLNRVMLIWSELYKTGSSTNNRWPHRLLRA